MTKEMWADVFAHQLKGIMFHADAYGISLLHSYRKLAKAHCHHAKMEMNNFMSARCKSIEQLGEIIDIPAVKRIDVPHNATEKELAEMWLAWESEAAEMYAKAVAAEPSCKWWAELHRDVSDEIKYITKMFF